MKSNKLHKAKGLGYRLIPGVLELLLDKFPGAAAAYSVQLLRADYSDGLLRARAFDPSGPADKGEADVKYDPGADYFISLNSPIENLDANAQSRLGTNAGGGNKVLADLVDTDGSNYDGFTPKWHDQTVNGNDIANGTATEQPKIVNSGSVIKQNGKPALQHNNNDYLFKNNMSVGLVEYFCVFYQNESSTQDGQQILFSDRYINNTYYYVGVSQKGDTSGGLSSNNVGSPNYRNNGSNLYSPNRDEFYNELEGQQNLINVQNISNLNSGFDFGLFGYTGFLLNGKVQCAILFQREQSSKRQEIEKEINKAFNNIF